MKRMEIQLIIQTVDMIQFCRGKMVLRRILDQPAGAMQLGQPLSVEGIVIFIKTAEHLGEGLLGLLANTGNLIKGRQGQVLCWSFRGRITEAANTVRIVALFKGGSQFNHGPLRHTVQEEIRLGIQKDGTTHGIGPVIIMGNAAEAGFDAAENNRQVFLNLLRIRLA